MQISAIEVAKLLAAESTRLGKQKTPDLEFKEITADELPESKIVEPDAAEVERVVQMVKEMPDVREEIVMRLKERIEKGEYKISGEEIAEMMLRRMRADRIR
ncbi:MAG: flagellar biosynthesis anti-sigma factor FlgM [Armatimonadota bacterium]|nr:flagellar biosynthesis anti-sigma factor FlgM [Armatimonadota bacterium]